MDLDEFETKSGDFLEGTLDSSIRSSQLLLRWPSTYKYFSQMHERVIGLRDEYDMGFTSGKLVGVGATLAQLALFAALPEAGKWIMGAAYTVSNLYDFITLD